MGSRLICGTVMSVILRVPPTLQATSDIGEPHAQASRMPRKAAGSSSFAPKRIDPLSTDQTRGLTARGSPRSTCVFGEPAQWIDKPTPPTGEPHAVRPRVLAPSPRTPKQWHGNRCLTLDRAEPPRPITLLTIAQISPISVGGIGNRTGAQPGPPRRTPTRQESA